jgi:IclR family acetate operon transcriptional repressor
MRVRRAGIGFDDAEFDSEMRCLAAPVRDFSGRVIGAVGLSGPIWRITLQRLHQLSDLIKSTADELSRELGYAPPS